MSVGYGYFCCPGRLLTKPINCSPFLFQVTLTVSAPPFSGSVSTPVSPNPTTQPGSCPLPGTKRQKSWDTLDPSAMANARAQHSSQTGPLSAPTGGSLSNPTSPLPSQTNSQSNGQSSPGGSLGGCMQPPQGFDCPPKLTPVQQVSFSRSCLRLQTHTLYQIPHPQH